MSRTLVGAIALIGLVLAAIAAVNIHSNPNLPTGQIIIGAIGLGVALFFAATMREAPTVQRVSTFGLIIVDLIMLVPTVWRAFSGASLSALQIGMAVLGAVLLFINWRMLPR